MFRWLSKFFLTQKQVKGDYDDVIEMYSRSTVDSTVYQNCTKIEVMFGTIDEYLGMLEKAIYALNGDIVFPALNVEAVIVKRCWFYRSQKLDYVDINIAHRQFCNSAILTLRASESIEKITYPSELLQTNYYRTQGIRNNLVQLASAL